MCFAEPSFFFFSLLPQSLGVLYFFMYYVLSFLTPYLFVCSPSVRVSPLLLLHLVFIFRFIVVFTSPFEFYFECSFSASPAVNASLRLFFDSPMDRREESVKHLFRLFEKEYPPFSPIFKKCMSTGSWMVFGGGGSMGRITFV